MINRAKRQNGYMYDGESKFLSFELGNGTYYITRDDAPVTLDLEMKTAENGKQYIWWGQKEELWQKLKKLNLKDPVIIEKIRKACSSNPEGND